MPEDAPVIKTVFLSQSGGGRGDEAQIYPALDLLIRDSHIVSNIYNNYWWPQPNRPVIGQYPTKDLPMTFLAGSVPQVRESELLQVLSPMTMYASLFVVEDRLLVREQRRVSPGYKPNF